MKVRSLAMAVLLATASVTAALGAEDDADARLAAAHDLLRAGKQDDLQALRIDLIVDRAKQQFMQLNPSASDAEAARYATVLHEELARDVSKLSELRARYYADHFTASELKDWTRMLQSDIGQKVVNAEPELLRDLTNVDYLWMQSAMQRTQARMQETNPSGANGL